MKLPRKLSKARCITIAKDVKPEMKVLLSAEIQKVISVERKAIFKKIHITTKKGTYKFDYDSNLITDISK